MTREKNWEIIRRTQGGKREVVQVVYQITEEELWRHMAQVRRGHRAGVYSYTLKCD